MPDPSSSPLVRAWWLLLAGAVVLATAGAGCRVMPGRATPSAPSTSSAVDPAAAFFARFADPPPYHVLMGVAISGVSSGSARIEGNVDGPDYHADVTVELAGLPPRDSEIVLVAGTAYLREADAVAWLTVARYRSTPPLNPFLLLDRSDFTDLGADPEHAGLRRLRSSTWVEQDATLGLVEGGVHDVEFDVWLDEGGVPVEGELDFGLRGVDRGGQTIDLRYSTLYTFTDVGVPVTIDAPTP